MTDTRQTFIEVATSLTNLPEFVEAIGRDDDLLRIDISTGRLDGVRRREIDRWFSKSITLPSLKTGRLQTRPLFRGVDGKSLQTALRQGIDVIPANHYWHGSFLDKALEYGGDYPNVLLLDASRCERTFREIKIDAPENDHEAARQFAQGEPMKSRDGTKLLYSRIPATDPARGSSYEFAHAHFIPGDASQALIGYLACRA